MKPKPHEPFKICELPVRKQETYEYRLEKEKEYIKYKKQYENQFKCVISIYFIFILLILFIKLKKWE